jgi:hypothetical protein
MKPPKMIVPFLACGIKVAREIVIRLLGFLHWIHGLLCLQRR